MLRDTKPTNSKNLESHLFCLDPLFWSDGDAYLIPSNQAIFSYSDEHRHQGKRSFPLQIVALT
jgi:hypothetical protein